MRAKTILAFFVALTPVAATAASPAPPMPPSAIMQLANAVVDASNTNDAAKLAKLYTSDAVVVDEVPPFVWRGSSAGVAWWHAVGAFLKNERHHIKLVDVRNGEFQSTATDAYLIQAMTILELGNGQPASESGTWTYTFRNGGGAWLISSQVWTTKP